jgi:hypothetical protein
MSFVSAFDDNVYTGAIMAAYTSQVYDICYLVSCTSIYLLQWWVQIQTRGLCVWLYISTVSLDLFVT